MVKSKLQLAWIVSNSAGRSTTSPPSLIILIPVWMWAAKAGSTIRSMFKHNFPSELVTPKLRTSGVVSVW